MSLFDFGDGDEHPDQVVRRLLVDVRYDRARGVDETNAKVLAGHLVDALGRIRELTGTKSENDGLEGQVEDLERDLETVTEERDTLENDLEEAREEVVTLKEEVASLTESLAEATGERGEGVPAATRISELEAGLADALARHDCGASEDDRSSPAHHCPRRDTTGGTCDECWAAAMTRSVGAARADEVATLRAELSHALVVRDQARAELAALRALSAPAPLPRPRRFRAVQRPGEVSLFDLVRPAEGGDLVVRVTEDAPAPVRTAGRECGCQRRGKHRATCPTKAAVGQ